VSGSDPRVRLEKSDVEDIFAAETTNWGDVPAVNDACNVAINRVVRFDSSGTTFEFKKFLETVDSVPDGDPDVNWTGLPNTEWPSDGTTDDAGEAGGQPLANRVAAVDGSIGYVVLGDGRDAGFQRSTTGTDDEYWVPLRSGAAGNTTNDFVDPSEFGVTSSTNGANCDDAQYTVPGGSLPSTTQSEPEWSRVVGFNSTTGYSVCALTYGLAWRDAADVEDPSNVIDEPIARTARDYLEYILTPEGQAAALGEDYSELPTDVLATANTGVDRVCWNMGDDTTSCD
jgi:PBP superfamily domain